MKLSFSYKTGAAVRVVGNETFRICEELVDQMITVSTDEICAAIKTAFNDTRSVLEPAGALGIAGMEKYIETQKGERFLLFCVSFVVACKL